MRQRKTSYVYLPHCIRVMHNIPDCIWYVMHDSTAWHTRLHIAEEIIVATLDNEHIGILSKHVLYSWPSTKLSYRGNYSHIGCSEMRLKGVRIIAPVSIQNKALKQLYVNHMGKEKTRLLSCECIYWVNMNVDIEETVKNCPTCLDFQSIWPKDKTLSHKIPGRSWHSVGPDMFTIMNKHYLCIVNYQSKIPIIKHVESPT